ncbi:hypothetical protein SOVF_037760 [Spinacia oleracea]|nr:hypothetical protein SOVF_037760 [Spinacia oleracea]
MVDPATNCSCCKNTKLYARREGGFASPKLTLHTPYTKRGLGFHHHLDGGQVRVGAVGFESRHHSRVSSISLLLSSSVPSASTAISPVSRSIVHLVQTWVSPSAFWVEYTWRLEFNVQARKDFDTKCANRLRDTLNKAAVIPLHQDIGFMTPVVRAEYVKRRQDPEFVKRSKRAKTNRLSGQAEGSFDPGHRQGSVSTPMVVAKMASLNNGVLPTAADVYEKTHSIPVGGEGETDLIGEKAIEIMDEYNEKLEAYKNKGIEHLSSHHTASSSTPSMTSQLSSQVEELKKKVEEIEKVAAESLSLAKAIAEDYRVEKAAWQKERKNMMASNREMATTILSVRRTTPTPTSTLTPTHTDS